MPRCLSALISFFPQVKGKDTGISIINSTKWVVCHNLRIKRNRVFQGLAGRGLKILTFSPPNTKTKSIQTEEEKKLFGRKSLIETVNDQLKKLNQIEHSRHPMVNIMAAVVAYCLNPNKPTFRNLLQK